MLYLINDAIDSNREGICKKKSRFGQNYPKKIKIHFWINFINTLHICLLEIMSKAFFWYIGPYHHIMVISLIYVYVGWITNTEG